MLPGPLPMDGTLIDGMESELVWIGTYRDPDEWCVEATMGGDFDADGVNDVVCNTQAWTEEGTLEFFRGGQFGQAALEADFGNGEENLFFSLMPDLDGDGANELALEWRGDSSIVDGASIASGVNVMDSIVAWVPGAKYNGDYFQGVADRTGDGVPDVMVSHEESCVGEGSWSVYLFDGTRTGAWELATAEGCFVGDADGGVASARDVDLDGDEVPEFLIAIGDGYVITPVHIPTWGEPVLDWGLALDGTRLRPGDNIGNIDVLGSGDDILLYDPEENADGIYNAYLYLNWDVPWFDRTYWPNAE